MSPSSNISPNSNFQVDDSHQNQTETHHIKAVQASNVDTVTKSNIGGIMNLASAAGYIYRTWKAIYRQMRNFLLVMVPLAFAAIKLGIAVKMFIGTKSKMKDNDNKNYKITNKHLLLELAILGLMKPDDIKNLDYDSFTIKIQSFSKNSNTDYVCASEVEKLIEELGIDIKTNYRDIDNMLGNTKNVVLPGESGSSEGEMLAFINNFMFSPKSSMPQSYRNRAYYFATVLAKRYNIPLENINPDNLLTFINDDKISKILPKEHWLLKHLMPISSTLLDVGYSVVEYEIANPGSIKRLLTPGEEKPEQEVVIKKDGDMAYKDLDEPSRNKYTDNVNLNSSEKSEIENLYKSGTITEHERDELMVMAEKVKKGEMEQSEMSKAFDEMQKKNSELEDNFVEIGYTSGGTDYDNMLDKFDDSPGIAKHIEKMDEYEKKDFFNAVMASRAMNGDKRALQFLQNNKLIGSNPTPDDYTELMQKADDSSQKYVTKHFNRGITYKVNSDNDKFAQYATKFLNGKVNATPSNSGTLGADMVLKVPAQQTNIPPTVKISDITVQKFAKVDKPIDDIGTKDLGENAGLAGLAVVTGIGMYAKTTAHKTPHSSTENVRGPRGNSQQKSPRGMDDYTSKR